MYKKNRYIDSQSENKHLRAWRYQSGDSHQEMELVSARFHHITQNGMQYETYELFVPGIFHLILSHHSSLRVTETADRVTSDKGGLHAQSL